MTLAQTIDLLGFAPVLAYTGADPAEDLVEHFSLHDQSQLAQQALGSAPLAAAIEEPGAPAGQMESAQSVRIYRRLGVVYGTVDKAGLAALREAPTVARVAAAPQVSLVRPTAENKRLSRRQVSWGISAMEITGLWGQGLSGTGVKVAHLDTGVDANHPALEEAVVKFEEFDFAGFRVAGASAHDSDTVQGHGTHTAAIVAGRAVGGRRVGVAPSAQVFSGMVIEGGDHVARMLAGMDWAIGQGVKILSMSVGLRGYHADFLGLIDALRDNDVLPVLAVGNEGPGTSRSPGNYPQVLSVGFSNVARAVDVRSSSQEFDRHTQPLVPDVVAPGTDIVSAKAGGGWRLLSGSSMAVPHVAGLLALLLEAHPEAPLAALERAVIESAALGQMPRQRANFGEVNGPRALAKLEAALVP